MFQGSDWEKVMYRFSQDRQLMEVHEAFVDFISGRARYDQPNPFASGFFGLDFANGFEEEDEYTDDDSDFEDRRDRRPYCGFNRNFLGHGPPRPRSPCLPRPSYKLGSQVKQIMYEEADKNAKELVEEEERRKIKAEKKRLKKLRQKERKRQEKEKENASKNKDSECPEAEDSVMKSNSSNSDSVDCKKDDKTTSVSPDTGPDFPLEEKPARSAHVQNNTSSSKPCEDDDEEDDDEDSDEESIASEPEVLDMSSCFVSKAATIAKRKMELKAKSDTKEEKKGSTRSTRKQEQQHRLQLPSEAEMRRDEQQQQQQSAEVASVEDVVNRSMELARIGNELAATGRFELAVTYFTDAIKHNPKEFRLFGNRSFCYERMQQYEKSLLDADITLAMNPGWIKGLYRRGRALAGLKRYCEAALAFKEVLKQDSTCTDAAQELMRVQIMQLMDMGFTREQSSNALIIHGTVEKALEAFSNIQDEKFGSSTLPVANVNQSADGEWEVARQRAHTPVSIATKPQTQAQPNSRPLTPVMSNSQKKPKSQPQVELFPVWVGNLVPAITEHLVHKLFSKAGPIHSVKLLPARRCAFVNYIRKGDCEVAINNLDGKQLEGTVLSVRYPDRIHTYLGASKSAKQATDAAPAPKPVPKTMTARKSDECYFWRTSGCNKNEKCPYKHIPSHKGIDKGKDKLAP